MQGTRIVSLAGEITHASEQLGTSSYWARVPRACAPQKKPAGTACVLRQSSPHSLKLETAHMKQRRLSVTKNKMINFLKKEKKREK